MRLPSTAEMGWGLRWMSCGCRYRSGSDMLRDVLQPQGANQMLANWAGFLVATR